MGFRLVPKPVTLNDLNDVMAVTLYMLNVLAFKANYVKLVEASHVCDKKM